MHLIWPKGHTRCTGTSSTDHQSHIISHAFTNPLHSLLSCTIIFPCFTDILLYCCCKWWHEATLPVLTCFHIWYQLLLAESSYQQEVFAWAPVKYSFPVHINNHKCIKDLRRNQGILHSLIWTTGKGITTVKTVERRHVSCLPFTNSSIVVAPTFYTLATTSTPSILYNSLVASSDAHKWCLDLTLLPQPRLTI